MSTLQRFEANQLPLGPGLRLLEASAGTGKTFALAHLVLRLLTEGADPPAVEQLLVVTFTEAAASELRDRIARRLQQALQLLDQPEANLEELDGPLQGWLERHRPQPSAPLRGRLLLALEQLDRADITTIHGFCRRTLQRQALEAGLGPAVSLESDGQERRQQLVHDYWRQQVLPLEPGLLAGLQQLQVNPAQLLQLVASLDGDPALALDPLPPELNAEQPLAPQLSALWPQRWGAFLEHWRTSAQALEADLAAAATELHSLGLEYKPYRLKPKADRLERVEGWIAGLDSPPDYAAVLAQRDLRDYFHPGPFTKAAAQAHGDGVSLPQRPLLEAVAALVEGPAELLLLHFAHWARRELAQRREAAGQMGFGQLLEQLDPGPDPAAPSPLLEAVARRYRAALIDEFQDTDPIQWRILRRAFTGPTPRHLLVMVGDPKQAIYRFRGGELATYRQAAQQVPPADRRGLIENRRSTPPLVAGLNALMAPGLQRSNLPVPPVEACARPGALPLPPGERPLQLLPLDPQGLEPQVAGLCQRLLERGLRPGDLCLLVSRHGQAEALRSALEQRQLPSRLVSRGDVFESPGAAALQRLLDALASPGLPSRQRLLAASPLLGWSAAELADAPPERWDALGLQLAELATRLPRQGLTAVLGQLLGTAGLARLSLRGRALADLQQAAELVQEQMHRQGLGAAAAADWLRRLRLEEQRDPPEEHLCRSDAAESAIAVVTVHRSKGLEYPVVICPYLWQAPKPARSGAQRLGRRWTPPQQPHPRLDLHLNPHWGAGRAAAQQHQEAQLAEAERLAYVACTRAQQLLVLGWPGDDRAEAGNPLTPWLAQPDLPLQQLEAETLPPPGRPWRPPSPEQPLELGPRPTRSLDSRWGRASYSAWAHSQAALAPQTRDEGRDHDAQGLSGDELSLATPASAPPDSPAPWPALGPLAQFPRGAGPGDVLHRILERLDYPALAAGEAGALAATTALLPEELARGGLETRWGEPLLQGLLQLVQSPLGGALGACRLGDLAPGHWLNELNFDLPLAVPPQRLVRSGGLAAVFQEHPGGRFGAAYGQQLRQLEVASRGFLTGSIDLVFRWGERWWVADWKSNWLGRRDGQGQVLACGPNDYPQEAMEALMASNHYPLQAHLYLVALHRYLRWRLPGYTPEQHLGGYAYVFLRGVPGPLPAGADPQAGVPGVLVEQPPLARLLALDQLLQEGQP
ncbi:MAG: DNA helicase UvrD [Cyanobacteria bacterium M_DeepCast_200m_mx_001]|nr:DNA helicase UvrD [Cyanobacteria bacterium M_DeepCast_200m_mx_001]